MDRIKNKQTQMSFSSLYRSTLEEHNNIHAKLRQSKDLENKLNHAARIILKVFKKGRKLLLFGNGGSAADAQHIATELVSKFFMERQALDADALNVNTSSLTAIGNDYSFDRVFSRQVEAKAKPGDVLIGITTSGTSKNIMAAFEAGKAIGTSNICFTGQTAPTSIERIVDIVIRVPSSCTPRVQEAHILIGHILCEYVEKELFKGKEGTKNVFSFKKRPK